MKLLLNCVILVLSALSLSQAEAPSATVSITEVKADKGVRIVSGTITLKLAPGYHAYQNPPTKDYMVPVTVTALDKAAKLVAKYPKGTVREVMGETAAIYEGETKIPFTVTLSKKSGSIVNLELGYQQCNESNCWPPAKLTLKIKLATGKAKKS